MSLFNWVERLILKNTSLLLSVTLMLRCSEPASPPSGLGGAESALSDIIEVVIVVVYVRVEFVVVTESERRASSVCCWLLKA